MDESQILDRFRARLSPAFLERYTLESLLGKGGMGMVYRGIRCSDGYEVAIKFMSGGLFEGDDAEVRFAHEAKAMREIQHPNLVQVLDSGKDGDVPFIVFEYVAGETLKAKVRRVGPLPVVEALAVCQGILQGLKVAHSQQLIHRDIKSENILLDTLGTARVADFGIAKSDRPQQTKTGVIIGTPAYMAPEQATGRPLDPRADVYSAGVVLFEMLTGRLPFGEENSMTTMMAHIHEPVPAPSYLVEGMPHAIDDLVAGALAKAPEDRYPSAAAFAIAVDTTLKRLQQAGFEGRTGARGPASAAAGPAGSAGTLAMHLPTGSRQASGGSPTSSTRASTRAEVETASAARTMGAATIRTLPASGPAPDRFASPSPSPSKSQGVAAGAVAVALMTVMAVGAWSQRGGAPTAVDLDAVLAAEASQEAQVWLKQIADPSEDPNVRSAFLVKLSEAVPPSSPDLAQAMLARLEEIHASLPPEPATDRSFVLALAALGDVRNYAAILDTAAELGTPVETVRAMRSLRDGLRRGRRPSTQQAEELAQVLWSFERGDDMAADERTTFFQTAAALGSETDVRRLVALVSRDERQSRRREFQAAVVTALQEIGAGSLPGSEVARRVLLPFQNDAGSAVALSDDERLASISAVTDSYPEVSP